MLSRATTYLKIRRHIMTCTKISGYSSSQEYNKHIDDNLRENEEHLKSLDYPGCKVVLPLGYGPVVPRENKKIFFFDIDNCLYKRSLAIHDMMQEYIHEYFKRTLDLNDEDAHVLMFKYYKEYGLAIQGLVKFHKIDALEYNRKVDDALPLQNVLSQDLKLRSMLESLRSSGSIDRMWLFTNAYKNHGERVISLLGIGDMFDGLWYCDYAQDDLICKPNANAFHSALELAGGTDFSNCYFVDDSADNIRTAMGLGFKKAIHFVERDEDLGKTPEGALLIRDILDLPEVVPELFQ